MSGYSTHEGGTKGVITRTLTVWCGLCDHWLAVDASEAVGAGIEARRLGWRKTLANGWVCGRHAKVAAPKRFTAPSEPKAALQKAASSEPPEVQP